MKIVNLDAYYHHKRQLIRRFWCPEIPCISLTDLSIYDKYSLGILLNAYEDDIKYMKFFSDDCIFIRDGKLKEVITDFLRKGVFKVNPKIHVTAFSDDGSRITNLTLVRFDLNCKLNQENIKAIHEVKSGLFKLTEADFIHLYTEAALSILYIFYADLCSNNFIKAEEYNALTPYIGQIVGQYSINDSLYYFYEIFMIFREKHHKNRNVRITSVFTSNCQCNSRPKNITYAIKIPDSIELDYLFSKVMKNISDPYNKTLQDLINDYKETVNYEC